MNNSDFNFENKENFSAAIKAPKSLVISEEIYNDIKLNNHNILVLMNLKILIRTSELKNNGIKYFAENIIFKSIHVDVNLLNGSSNELDIEKFKNSIIQYDKMHFSFSKKMENILLVAKSKKCQNPNTM